MAKNVISLCTARVLPDPELSVAQYLRNVADSIEQGEYGAVEDVLRGALVLRVRDQEPLVFGFGAATLERSCMDFHAGAAQMMAMDSD